MLKSEVEDLINNWYLGVSKVFRTYNHFVLDYVLIKRENDNLFVCEKQKSTTDVGEMNKETMEKLIGAGIFIYEPLLGVYDNLRHERSKNCQCGAHMTANKDCHSFWCPLHRSY